MVASGEPPNAGESPARAALVAGAVCFVCSLVVALSVVILRPKALENQERERQSQVRALIQQVPGLDALLEVGTAGSVEAVVVELASGEVIPDLDPAAYEARSLARDPERTEPLSSERDLAQIGRRPPYVTVYLVWRGARIVSVVLPVYGSGYASTLHGYLALAADGETVRAIRFYEHAETPGVGSVIESPEWASGWRGKRLRDASGEVRIRVVKGRASGASPEAEFEVDGISGATRTGDGVTKLVRFWVGPDGFGRFLDRLRSGALDAGGRRS